jgi:ferredoxin
LSSEKTIEGPFEIELDIDLCQGHGVCRGEAPEIFDVIDVKFGYAKVKLLQHQPDVALHDGLLNAVKYCPNHVIRIKRTG